MDPKDRERIFEKAADVGRLLSQTAEFRYLRAADREMGEDREAVERLNRLRELEEQVFKMLEAGEKPPAEIREEIETISSEIESRTTVRSWMTAKENFDRLMDEVQEAIGKGIRAGEQSGIIVP
jgi:cell fate (sporulation/competence/biofilm development) regulator YlbF (YheA/YmcA/DUF963 family)